MYYVVGQHIAKTDHGHVWDFQGIFDSRETAEKVAINGGKLFFVAPCELNQILPKETQYWPDAYYPSQEG